MQLKGDNNNHGISRHLLLVVEISFFSHFRSNFKMLSERFRRILKYGTAGLFIGGSAYGMQKNDWEMSTVGVMRFGRAAFAVSHLVIIDLTLYQTTNF